MSKILGRATVRVNGQELLIDNGAKLNLGGVQRNTVKGTTVHGFVEEAMEPFIECSASVTRGQDLRAFDTEDATVLFEADTGQAYVIPNAWLESPIEVTAQEGGRVPLKYVGKEVRQLR